MGAYLLVIKGIGYFYLWVDNLDVWWWINAVWFVKTPLSVRCCQTLYIKWCELIHLVRCALAIFVEASISTLVFPDSQQTSLQSYFPTRAFHIRLCVLWAVRMVTQLWHTFMLAPLDINFRSDLDGLNSSLMSSHHVLLDDLSLFALGQSWELSWMWDLVAISDDEVEFLKHLGSPASLIW